MIAAIYARKSTEQQGVADDQKSVARQIEHASASAVRKGWHVAPEHVYVDDGISGAEFAARPGYVRLLNALGKRAPFDVLIVSELSRLGREQLEVGYAVKQLSQAGVRIYSYLEDKEVALTSATDKFLMSAVNFAADMERERAQQRTRDAMVRKALAGHATGFSPFGYRHVEVKGPDGKRSHVERRVEEREAAVIRRIFKLTAQGLGKQAIAKLLNGERALAPRPHRGGPRGWSPSTVGSVLHRHTYRGVVVWGKRKKRDQWGSAKPSKRPESEWLTVEVPELAVVTQAQWDAAHERLSATRTNYLRQQNGKLWGRPPAAGGMKAKYLLVGIARCGVCGGGLEMRSRATTGKRRIYYYACREHFRRGLCANAGEIPLLLADRAVVESFLAELLTPERLATVAERAVALVREQQEARPDLRAELERALAECNAEMQRLVAAVAAGIAVPAIHDAIKTRDEQRRAIERQLAALAAPAPTFDDATARRLREAVAEWRAALGRQVPLARQIVQKLLAEKIVFTPEERDGCDGFRFQATGTVEKLIAGTVPGAAFGSGLGCLPAGIPPTGIEPVLPP